MQSWLRNGWLTEHRSSRQEIENLLRAADRDLADSRASGLSADWRLSIAYNAALLAATAALTASGYRASRDMHHYRVIQSLAFTVKGDPALIDQLDRFRKKRNISDYERAGAVSDQEAEEMLELASGLRSLVEEGCARTTQRSSAGSRSACSATWTLLAHAGSYATVRQAAQAASFDEQQRYVQEMIAMLLEDGEPQLEGTQLVAVG